MSQAGQSSQPVKEETVEQSLLMHEYYQDPASIGIAIVMVNCFDTIMMKKFQNANSSDEINNEEIPKEVKKLLETPSDYFEEKISTMSSKVIISAFKKYTEVHFKHK